MPIRLIDPAYRLVLRAAYPLMCRWQQVSGRRSRVAVVAVWYGGEILVVRHSYRPGLELPGGDQRRTESAIEAAVRELREEVGLETNAQELVPVTIEGSHQAWLTLFEYHPKIRPEPHIDNREIIDAAFTAPSQVNNASQTLKRYLKNIAKPHKEVSRRGQTVDEGLSTSYPTR